MTDNDTPERETLNFDSDAGSSRSKWVAGGLSLAIFAWMGSGYILPSSDGDSAQKTAVEAKAVSVAVRASTAELVDQVFVAEGQALPDRDTLIRTEISGQIAEVLAQKGDDLEAGQVIARIQDGTRTADLTRAQEELNRAQREYDNAVALRERGIATADRVASARATLASAQAGLTAANEAIGKGDLTAPFAGRLEELDINEGEFVSAGAQVARIVDNTPLSIRIQVPQQALKDIKVGQEADVDFITGISATGVVKFVGTSANAETRTFQAEIEVDNADGAIPAGISAQLRIPTGELVAHFVSPAILSLGTDGTLGVKTVNGDDVVEFHEVSIVRAQTDGIWVSRLPEQARIIAIGQGFVSDGERVTALPEGEDGQVDQ